jgi:alpha-D-xyloside xylohydrolase
MSENIAGLLTDDSRIFHRHGFAYDWVDCATGAAFEGNVMTVDLKLESGRPMKLSVEAVAEGTFRLRAWQGTVPFDETSPMLAVPGLKRLPARFRETKEVLVFTAGGNSLRVTKGPFGAALLDAKGRVLWQLESEDRAAGALVAPHLGYRTSPSGVHPFLSWRIENDEHLFGLGEKFNKVEKTGTRCTIWTADTAGLNTTDLAYKAVPVLFSTRGWGMMLHSSFRSYWEVGSFSYVAGSFLTEDEKIDLFLFAAPTLKGLLGKYTALTGRPAMPPKWALGVWLSRCSYPTRQAAEAAARGMRQRKIPCDVVHLDPPWMKVGYYPILGVDACDFDWNERDFPDRAAMFRQFAADGFAVCLWINPYLPEGTPTYREAADKGYMVKDPSGRPARNEQGQTVGVVDFTKPEAREWWKDHLKALLRDGASVFKPDYGERVPEDGMFHNGRTGREMHNLYLFLYQQAVIEATREQTGRSPIWGRSGYIGSQRFPGTWAGDTQVMWRAMKCCLRGGLSAGLTGFSFWSHDIGGFVGPKPSPELYIRWAQWGLLSPLSRFHGTTPREPWEYGAEAEGIVARCCRLRYGLIPYLLAAAEESCRTGVPIMRHMALEFPDEANAHTLDDQYVLGPDLLVAPVLVEGARSRQVYLPAGVWTELDRPRATHDGPGFVKLAAPLSRIPVLVREGAVIPRLPGNPQHLKGGPAPRLVVDVYPGGGARAMMFQDEDVQVSVRAQSTPAGGSFTIGPAPMSVKVRFLRVRARRVACTGLRPRWKATPRGTEVEFRADKGARVRLVL